MTRSASRRASLARGRVVWMASCSSSEVTMLSSIASRWLVVFCNFLCPTRCRIANSWRAVSGTRLRGVKRRYLDSRLDGGRDGSRDRNRRALHGPAVQLHSQGEPHLGEVLLDLLQRLPTEVLRLQHFRFAALDEVPD